MIRFDCRNFKVSYINPKTGGFIRRHVSSLKNSDIVFETHDQEMFFNKLKETFKQNVLRYS